MKRSVKIIALAFEGCVLLLSLLFMVYLNETLRCLSNRYWENQILFLMTCLLIKSLGTLIIFAYLLIPRKPVLWTGCTVTALGYFSLLVFLIQQDYLKNVWTLFIVVPYICYTVLMDIVSRMFMFYSVL